MPGTGTGEEAGSRSVTERSQTLERKLGVRLQSPGREGESQEGLSQATGYAATKVTKSLAETEGQWPAMPAQEGRHRHKLGDRKAAVLSLTTPPWLGADDGELARKSIRTSQSLGELNISV